MPTYQYQCGKCKSLFELRQSFSDEPKAVCPACQSVAQRLFSPVPILFKGSGFYVTDSRVNKEEHMQPVKTAKEEEKQGG